MRVHSLQKIEEIKKARKLGASILDLVKRFGVPKTTIWHHINKIKLSKIHIQKLKSNQGGSVIRYRKQMQKALDNAKEIIKSIENLQQITPLIVSLLYWAEGNKRGFIFTNTDDAMIKLFLKVIRSYFGVQNEDIVIMVRIAKHADARKAALYWSRVTGISFNKIRTDVNQRNNKSRARYGICRVRVNKGSYLSKLVKCLNEELTSAII